MRPILRLLADDLTGALDAAAEFAALCGPVPVPMADAGRLRGGSLALDSATREASRAAAVARVAALAPALGDADIAYKKLDSLLRGHVAAELAACLAAGPWRHCILAPAFPAQGRITRGGWQLVRQPGGAWSPAAMQDLHAMFAAEGLPTRPGATTGPLAEGISIFDAETDTDLACIAEIGRAAARPVLWCGSGGLAAALAGPARVVPDTRLAAPVLGLLGSDQATTTRQLAACGGAALRIAAADPDAARRVAQRLRDAGVAMVSLDLPPGLAREEAARCIAAAFAALLRDLPRPGTLVAAGGETLAAVCRALGAQALLATGLVAPGVPRSALRGGAWDGLALVSKSGAFGGDMLWRDLLASNGLPIGSPDA